MNQIILETNFTEKYQAEPTHKHVLHRDNLFFLYNQFDDHGCGWQTRSFTDLEKALKFFLKRIAEDRKTLTGKNLKIVCPQVMKIG